MPFLPLRVRIGLVLAAILLAAPIGCESFRLGTNDRTEKASSPPEPLTNPSAAAASDPSGAAEIHPIAEPGAIAASFESEPTIRPGDLPASNSFLPPGRLPPLRCGNYVFFHDFELNPDDPLFAELEVLPDQVFGELELPPTNAIVQVYLFETKGRYEGYMHARYPDLPTRRAYMIASGREVKVFTWMGQHLRTDLRHELTHALLRSVLKDVPLWLDEGLAGYFELPPESRGINAQHLEELTRAPFDANLERLEKIDRVNDMQKPEYMEAWAWVHFMLRDNAATRRVLLDYLQLLRIKERPGPLMARLKKIHSDPNLALDRHLKRESATFSRASTPR